MWYTDSNNQSGDCQHNHFSALSLQSRLRYDEKQPQRRETDKQQPCWPDAWFAAMFRSVLSRRKKIHIYILSLSSSQTQKQDPRLIKNTICVFDQYMSYFNNNMSGIWNMSYFKNNNNKRALCPYMQAFTRLSLNIITSKQQQIQKHIFFAIMLQFNPLCNMCG